MNNNLTSLSLFQKTLLSLIPTALLITFCYFWADPAFAFWSDHENFRQFPIFDYFTHIVDAIVIWSVLYYGYFAYSFSKEKQQSLKKGLNSSTHAWPSLNVANSVSISIFIKDALKEPFGRYWPNTWTNNNPSLIHDHAYGFHWFHKGVIYQSFPSGHTTVAVAMMVALWLSFPQSVVRYLGVLLGSAIIIGLLADNYHFLGDCAAGAWVGATVAIYVTAYSKKVRLPTF
ncbi:MAG: phosphatase PAP2 family protein [Chthoniobacterales bacterium]|nr:phosphatase PAP2 family protein [Chthoniobacterales bacterium]